MKKLTALILVLIMVLSLMPAAFAALELKGKTIVAVGEEVTWEANQFVWWTSINKAIATIDQNGNIKALKPGVANITATTSTGEKKTFRLIVLELTLAGKTSAYLGESAKWTASVKPATRSQAVVWSSSNTSVATIDQNGNIITRGIGTTYITATAENGVRKTVSFTVYGAPRITPVNLAGKTVVSVGETTRWTASQKVWWGSGNTGVATIDQNGNIKAIRAGVTNITATANNGAKKTVLLTVAEVKLAGKTGIYVGDTVKWTASVAPSSYSQWVSWTSGNPGVATVDKNGNIKALRAGQSNITATGANGIKKTVLLNVYNRAGGSNGIALSGATVISVGGTTRWTANQAVWWTSGNPGVATIDQNGNIRALKAGQSNITATANNGAKKTVLFTVAELKLAGKTTISVGENTKWTASVVPSNVSQWVSWTSGNPGVATVDQNGNIRALKAGQSNITVTGTNGLKKTVLLTVVSNTPDSNLAWMTNVGDAQMMKSSAPIVDNYGNTYATGIYFYQGGEGIQFIIAKKYSRFRATLYRPAGETDGTRHIEVYGDGKLIYTSPAVNKLSAPVYIDISVAGYNNIRIKPCSNPGYKAVHLANAGFYK